MHPWEKDVHLLKEALNKGPSVYEVVIEIAYTQSSEELLGGRKVYHFLFDHSIEEDVASHIHDFERKVKCLCMTLEAFSVENKIIKFQNSSSGSCRQSWLNGKEGNIILDSGTTLVLLPDDVYSKLESAVADAVKLQRVEDPSKQLSLCYQTTSDKLDLDVPVITAHFSGADVKLNVINTFVQVADKVACLAFQSSQIGPIFGNLAQQNLLVGYDVHKKIVSFKPTDCSKQ